MRRFLLVLSAVAAMLGVAAPASATTATGCVPSSTATYRHTFDGAAGTTTITATRPLCTGQTQTFSVISYTTGAYGTAAGQFIYETASGTVTATNRTLTLRVAVPDCYTQVDAIFGRSYQTESTTTEPLYGTAKLGATSRSQGPLAWYAGGSAPCTAKPAVTFTNACDGTFTALLSNSGGTPAVFLTGSRRIRLFPGASTTLRPAKGSTLTIRDSSFTTYVATWRAPAEACPVAPAPPGPTLAAPTSTAPATATTSPSASPPPSASTSASPYSSPNPAFTTNPAALTPATSGTGPAGGMSLTSVLAIIMGLLMIAAGVTALTWLIRSNRRLA